MLRNIRIVLVETTHPGNIGATARAMKNMGLERLYLVNPKIFPNVVATARAAGADDLLENAVVVNSLDQALRDCHSVFGTSARLREMPTVLLNPREAASKILESSTAASEVALVFGQENNGLSNEDLMRCNYQINIPSNPNFSSLNIASAVQLIAYEIYYHYIHKQQRSELQRFTENQENSLVTRGEAELFYSHLERVLTEIDFLQFPKSRKLMPRLRRLFNRVFLEKMELNILRGILTAIEQKLSAAKGEK